MSKANHSSTFLDGLPNCYCRATFTEILIRLGKYLFCDVVDEKDLVNNNNEYERTPISRAFKLYIEIKLQSYFLNQGLNRSSFRDDKLYD